MELGISEINWLAVLAAGVLYMVVGGIWYGPIAGAAWMEVMGKTAADFEGKDPKKAMISSFIASVVFAIGLAVLLNYPGLREFGAREGALVGFFVSVLFVGAGSYPNYAFEEKTMRHFLIHMGNMVIAMILMGALLAAWR